MPYEKLETGGSVLINDWPDAISVDVGHETRIVESVHDLDMNDLHEAISSGDSVEISDAGGFYWRACFPGCLPDSDPFGPFDTYAEALNDAEGD
jgi:hypothetical protein